MKKLLTLAIILRLLVGAFYFHPDIKTFNYQASFLRQRIFNIYTHLSQNKKSLPLKEEFVYFPLAYLSLGVYQTLVLPILGSGFDAWLANAEVNAYVRDPNVFRYLTILKFPYLVLDLVIAYLLFNYFEDKARGKKALLIWLFNPFTIVLFYVFGNIDIWPSAISLGALFALKQKKTLLATLLLCLAAGFKLYPLLFLPFVVSGVKEARQKLKIILISLLTLLGIVLPFLSQAFVDSALVSGLSTRIFNPGLPIGFNETIIIGLFAYVVLIFWAFINNQNIDYLKYFTASLLLIFSFAHFHIQWLSWLSPFLVILVVKRPKLASMVFLIALLAFLIPPLYEDRFMTISLFRLYSTLYDILPTPFSLLQNFYDPYNLQSIIHTVFAGANIVLIYKMFSKKV